MVHLAIAHLQMALWVCGRCCTCWPCVVCGVELARLLAPPLLSAGVLVPSHSRAKQHFSLEEGKVSATKSNKCVLQACDLFLALLHALLIGLSTVEALLGEALLVLEDSIKFFLSSFLVRDHILDCFEDGGRGLLLVLLVGSLLDLGVLVLINHLGVVLYLGSLNSLSLGKVSPKVALNNLEHANDSSGGSRLLGVAELRRLLNQRLRSASALIVVAEDRQCHADTFQTSFQVRLGNGKGFALLLSCCGHLSLVLSHVVQLLEELVRLTLQAGGFRLLLFNLGYKCVLSVGQIFNLLLGLGG